MHELFSWGDQRTPPADQIMLRIPVFRWLGKNSQNFSRLTGDAPFCHCRYDPETDLSFFTETARINPLRSIS